MPCGWPTTALPRDLRQPTRRSGFRGLLDSLAHSLHVSQRFVERLWRSVKHEDVYLRGYAGLPELLVGLTRYFEFYNLERKHQSLGYLTPEQVYRTAIGGGARIVDHFTSGTSHPAESGQRRSAASDPAPS